MTTKLTQILVELDEIIEAGEKATEKPWKCSKDGQTVWTVGTGVERVCAECEREDSHAIALFHNVTPKMAQTMKGLITELETDRRWADSDTQKRSDDALQNLITTWKGQQR